MSIQCTKKDFSIQTGKQVLCVPWWSLLLFLLITGLFAYLSHWQYTRYQSQRIVAKQWIENEQKSPLEITDAHSIASTNHYRTIRISGIFHAKNIFVDNALYHHNAGYQVITPFAMPGNDRWLLVNRGWIPYTSESHRMLIPMLSDIVGPQTLEGQLFCPQKKPVLLNKRSWNRHGETPFPMIAQTLDLERIEKALDHPIHACYLRLKTPKALGFIQEWHTTPLSPYRHLGYAFQWGLFGIIFWIIFFLKHRSRAR